MSHEIRSEVRLRSKFGPLLMIISIPSLICSSNSDYQVETKLKNFSFNASDRIRAGEKVTKMIYPAHIMLMASDQSSDRYICGGALLELDLVVTAAHCLYNKEKRGLSDPANYRIRAGEYTMDPTDEESTKQDQKLFSFRHNGKYTGEFKDGNDIALLKLLKPLQKTEFVASIPACSKQQEFDKNLPVQVVGFGLTGYENGEAIEAKFLKKLDVTEVSAGFCTSFEGPPDKSIVCIETLGQNALCKGDSGSGLYKMDPKTNKPLCVYGVVSMGPGCKGKSVYTTFTRISYYLESLQKVYVSSTAPEEGLRRANDANRAESSLVLVFLLTGILILNSRKRAVPEV